MEWTAEKEVNGDVLKVVIERDEYYEHDDDELGTLVGSHRRYNFFERAQNTEKYSSWDEWRENELEKDCFWLPVYMYDHSGITLSTNTFSCPWDSGQLGVIYATRKQVREWYQVKRITSKVAEKVYDYFNGQLDMLNAIHAGNVYQYTLYRNGEEVDSCCGFIRTESNDETFLENVAEEWEGDFKPLLKELT